MDILKSMALYLTSPNSFATFWIPICVLALLIFFEFRACKFKLPIWLLGSSVALMPVTYFCSSWIEHANGIGFHILPFFLIVLVVASWMCGQLSIGSAVLVLYSHAICVDAFALISLLGDESPAHPHGLLRGLGAAGWGDYLLILPIRVMVGLGVVEFLVVPLLAKFYPVETALKFPHWVPRKV
jgi:hypothetical protein